MNLSCFCVSETVPPVLYEYIGEANRGMVYGLPQEVALGSTTSMVRDALGEPTREWETSILGTSTFQYDEEETCLKTTVAFLRGRVNDITTYTNNIIFSQIPAQFKEPTQMLYAEIPVNHAILYFRPIPASRYICGNTEVNLRGTLT